MNDIISAAALVALSLLTLAGIGWFAMPKPERGRLRDVTPADTAAMVRTGARLTSTWGPRLDFSTPATAVTPSRADDYCTQS